MNYLRITAIVALVLAAFLLIISFFSFEPEMTFAIRVVAIFLFWAGLRRLSRVIGRF